MQSVSVARLFEDQREELQLEQLTESLASRREITVSVYRISMGRRGVSVPARLLAKVKTVVQEVAVGFALLPLTTRHPVVADACLWAAVVLALASGAQYLLDARTAVGAHAL